MLDPIRLVTDLFKEKNFTYSNLRTFTEIFLIRLANPDNNPGGKYNQLMVDTTLLYQSYYGSIKDEASKVTIAEGLTMSMNQALDVAIKKLSSLQGLIKFKFGADSEIYNEFYPRGMEHFHQAKIGNIGPLLIEFLVPANSHLLPVEPGEVGILTTVINNFMSARQAQMGMYSTLDTVAYGRRKGRKDLTLQLTKCFLIIAADHLEKPREFHNYYEVRYLPIRKGKKKEDAKKSHHVKHGEKKDVFEF